MSLTSPSSASPPAVFNPGALHGEVRVGGDKSISHRALMLALLSSGTSRIEGLNLGEDVAATRDAILALGAELSEEGAPAAAEDYNALRVRGGALRNPIATIDARNSGTTARLLMGLCAGNGVTARFDGDESLRRRPMERVAAPLRAFGAQISTSSGRLPTEVRGIAEPPGGDFALEIPSAQVKSAILLAGVHARGVVRITGDQFSRDHTERMLRAFGRTIAFDGRTIELQPGPLTPQTIRIPGDFSGAAFFIVAAAITPGSDLLLRNVGLNPTRTGLLDALRTMGADIEIRNAAETSGEPVGDVRVRYRPLVATTLGGDDLVRAIDEVPAFAVAAAHAAGTTRIRDASELRAKESDRLDALAATLRACGVEVREYPDGLDITGGTARPPKDTLQTRGDHRIAMAIAALAAPSGPHEIDDAGCIAISFPEFEPLWREAQRAG
jgi:3-phosphoshikimate 1-carboxyvinyltransferase